jgi:DNA-binding SARP family transcriptional activator
MISSQPAASPAPGRTKRNPQPLHEVRPLDAWPVTQPGSARSLHVVAGRQQPAAVTAAASDLETRLCGLLEQVHLQLLAGAPLAALETLESALRLMQNAPAPGGPAVTPVQPSLSPCACARVVVHTLGRFEVLVDGAPLCTGRKHPRRTLALLKALIALGGSRVCRTALVDLLWPDIDGDLGQNALEVTLHRLRCRLRVPEAIVARDGCLALDSALVWVDALAFANGTAPQPIAVGTPPPFDVQAMFDLYRGAFLPEDRDSVWSMRMREKLRTRFVRSVAEAAARLEASGQYAPAAQLYERALAVDDLACVFHDGLARCLERLGRGSEASMALERGTQLLRECRDA